MEILLGAGLSIVFQFLKAKVAGEYQKLAVLFVLSLAVAGVYTALVTTGYWESVASILMTAGAVYAFVIQRFEQ